LPWLRRNDTKACFIPIGANIPEMLMQRQLHAPSPDSPKTVAVFCVTTVRKTVWEVTEIATAVRCAKKSVPHLRLLVFGRGAMEARYLLEDALADTGTELSVLGVIPAVEIARILSESDALLYVRDPLTPQHGCALAAIACGLPLIAYGDEAECFPLSEAGILLAQPGDRNALCTALERVLTDQALWAILHERSVKAYKKYFTWEEIGRKFAATLQAPTCTRLESPVPETPELVGRGRASSPVAMKAGKEEYRSDEASDAI
jgi:glycosyltransferase involved in cell wall biosynthesis